MSQEQSKKRKRKVSKGQTLSARRRFDKARREQNRPREQRRRIARRTFKFRVKVVRLYRHLKMQLAEKKPLALCWNSTPGAQPGSSRCRRVPSGAGIV